MVYRKITVHTTEEAEDILISDLADLGIEGAEIQDRAPISEADTKGMFIDILPDLGPDDGRAEVIFYCEVMDADAKKERLQKVEKMMNDPAVDASYVPNSANVFTEQELEDILKAVRQDLSDMSSYVNVGEARIEISETEDRDWVNNWKSFFHPFTVDNLLIKPVWEPMPGNAEGRTVIEIDPGTAFGTGMHETTRLCMRALEKYVTPRCRILDIGTGSGILGITALKLGAGKVYGTDLDEEALPAVSENLKINHLPASDFEVSIGNVIGDENADFRKKIGLERYDIVTANILAPVIILLCGVAGEFLKKDGIFITSGIVSEKKQDVLNAFRTHKETFDVLGVEQDGEWVSVTARKK